MEIKQDFYLEKQGERMNKTTELVINVRRICPVCNGIKYVVVVSSGTSTTKLMRCPTCNPKLKGTTYTV